MLSNLNKKPYILKTTLEPNQIYSCFGIKIKVKEQVDTFSNKGNFSIHINNINLKALKSQSHNTITKDTPLFCYVQESNQTHIVKLQDSTTSINIQLNKNLPKDSNGNLIPIIPKLIFLSFIPFRDSKEANNSPSQKISLTADDINKNYINVDFKIPLKYLGEWQNIKTHKLQQIKSNKSKEIISIKFNGKTLQILEKGEAKQEFTFKAQSGDNGNKETMIEEGNYYIKANEVIEANIINNVNIDINQFNLGNKYIKLHKNTSDKNIADKNTSNNNTANKNTSNKETSNKKTLKDDSLLTKALNLVKIQSTAYTIHGGKSYGDNKGIDLATQDLAFFKALQKLTNKYKVELENANNEIRVEVGYEGDLSNIEIVGKNGLDISLITEYSKNILREVGRDSNNPIIIITDVARTPKDQANRMYNMIRQNSINKAKQTYKKQVHSVIDIYENLANQGKTKTDILNAMEQEIKRLVLLGCFQHCQDFDIKNTFDISVRLLKNADKFYEIAKKYEETHQDFKIIDESKNKEKCYHIEITQP